MGPGPSWSPIRDQSDGRSWSLIRWTSGSHKSVCSKGSFTIKNLEFLHFSSVWSLLWIIFYKVEFLTLMFWFVNQDSVWDNQKVGPQWSDPLGTRPTLVASQGPARRLVLIIDQVDPRAPQDPSTLRCWERLKLWKNGFSDLFLSAGWILGMDFTT